MSARSSVKTILYTFGLTLWVVFALFLGQSLAGLAIAVLPESVNEAVLTTIIAALGYTFAIALALGIPALIWRKWAGRSTLGIGRAPSWTDIGLGIMSILPYYLLSGALVWLGMEVFTVIDPDVGQQIPFQDLTERIELFVAFITLVMLAPFAEELLFRGYFLGRVKERTGKWVALLVTSVVFGLMHLPGLTENGLVLQWSAAADTFAMGLIAGSLRLLSGSIWAGVLLHATKNAIAFYFLFINPLPPGGM